VVGLAAHAVNGRLVLEPRGAALDVLGLENTTFGWIAIPTAFVSPFVDWLQHQLDQAAQVVWFDSIRIGGDRMILRLHLR
jgi:hypothetical protein